MPIGYNVIQPNGVVRKLRAADDADRKSMVDALQGKWKDYCQANWQSWSDDPYSPENRVKLFLNGISYFLMVGNTEGVVTDYKDIMNGKREIPISSCPSCVEDAVYGGGSTICTKSPDEDTRFDQMLDRLDFRASKVDKSKPAKKKKTITKTDRLREIRTRYGKCEFLYPIVDTENGFMLNGEKYVISDQAIQYAPKQTPQGELYDMDRIVCVVTTDGVQFYDMDINRLPDDWIIRQK